MGRPCDYSLPPAPADDPTSLRSRIQQLEQLVARLSDRLPPTALPVPGIATTADTVFTDDDDDLFNIRSKCVFLDSSLSDYCDFPHDVVRGTVPGELMDVLRDRVSNEKMVSNYFRSVNTWMPILNKSKLERLIDSEAESHEPRADLALLLVSMKLIQEVPQRGDAQYWWLYTAAKRFCFTLEIQGLHSLIKLQASLIIATYELGHAIFPAAYTSIGDCARHGIALGLHNKLAPQMLRKPRSWVDWEERQRVWWFIIILDRYVITGSDNRPLCTDDPTPDMYIPTNDAAWEQGEIVPPERVILSSPVNIPVSPFARVAQASNLLGRVIRHCNDRTCSPASTLNNIELLHRIISSLISLLTDDADTAGSFYQAHSICLSALMKLDGNHTCDSYDDDQPPPIEEVDILRECMAHGIIKIKEDCIKVVYFAEALLKQVRVSGSESISPLVLYCIYRAAIALSWCENESGEEQYASGKAICEELLRTMNTRWKAAGSYLTLLSVAEREMRRETF